MDDRTNVRTASQGRILIRRILTSRPELKPDIDEFTFRMAEPMRFTMTPAFTPDVPSSRFTMQSSYHKDNGERGEHQWRAGAADWRGRHAVGEQYLLRARHRPVH